MFVFQNDKGALVKHVPARHWSPQDYVGGETPCVPHVKMWVEVWAGGTYRVLYNEILRVYAPFISHGRAYHKKEQGDIEVRHQTEQKGVQVVEFYAPIFKLVPGIVTREQAQRYQRGIENIDEMLGVCELVSFRKFNDCLKFFGLGK